MESKRTVDGDGWICLNDDEKKIVQRMRLKTEKELIGRIQFPRMWMWKQVRWERCSQRLKFPA